MSADRVRTHIKISGDVQGVFFRANTKKLADSLNLVGFVKNTEDGKVEIIAEGKKQDLEILIEFCKKGPEGAKVEKVEIKYTSTKKEYEEFKIFF